MTTIIASVRLLRARGIDPKGILSTEFDNTNNTIQEPFRITNNNNMYRVFNLVSGLDDFVSYGRADKLADYYKEDILFQKLEEMGKTFLLCHPFMMLESLRAVVKELDNRTANYSDAMKNYVVDEVRRVRIELPRF